MFKLGKIVQNYDNPFSPLVLFGPIQSHVDNYRNFLFKICDSCSLPYPSAPAQIDLASYQSSPFFCYLVLHIVSLASLFLLKISTSSFQLLYPWSSSVLVPLAQSFFLLGIAGHVLLHHNIVSSSIYKLRNLCPSLVFCSLVLLPTYTLFFVISLIRSPQYSLVSLHACIFFHLVLYYFTPPFNLPLISQSHPLLYFFSFVSFFRLDFFVVLTRRISVIQVIWQCSYVLIKLRSSVTQTRSYEALD